MEHRTPMLPFRIQIHGGFCMISKERLLFQAYILRRDERVQQYAMIFLGCVISAIGINMMLTPLSLLADGAVGIAGIFYLTLGIPVSITLLVINIPLFWIFRNQLTRQFLRLSIFGFIVYTIILEGSSGILATHLPTQDLFLAALFGGVLNGVGCGFVFRANASTGGVDLVGAVIKKKYGMDIGTTCFIANAILVVIAMAVLSVEVALYTLFSMYVTGILTNRTIDGLNTKKVLLIISKKYAAISNAIISNVERSTTLIKAEGGFSSKDTKIVLAVVSMSQIAEVREILKHIDKHAFLLILDAADVKGASFTKTSGQKKFRMLRHYLQEHPRK